MLAGEVVVRGSSIPAVFVCGLVGCAGDREPASGLPADPCERPGAICTWMGLPGVALLSADDLDRTKTGLYLVQDVAFDPRGRAFVADFNNHRVLQVDSSGTAHTIAGTGVPGDGPSDGKSCATGCTAHSTEIWHPADVAIDPKDPDLVMGAMWHNHRLVQIDTARDVITWVVGAGEEGYSDDPPLLAWPSSIVPGERGEWYFSDQGNQVVRRLGADGTLSLVAGTPRVGGYAGDGGPALEAKLHGHADWVGGPTSKLALRGSRLYLADTLNGVIRVIDLDRGTIDRVAGRFVDGAATGSRAGYSGDDGPALDAVFDSPRAIAFGPKGELYVADTGNNCIRVVGADGIVRRFAGQCGKEGSHTGDGGSALDATMNFPCGITVDDKGYVYVSDSNDNVVRRIAPSAP